MPTPSSNSLPEASSSRSINLSTCPDDIQQQHASSSWQSHDAVQDHPDQSSHMGVQPAVDGAAPLTVDAPRTVQGLATEDAIFYERASGNQPDEPSSRSSTTSPRPQSTLTDLTSPTPSGPESDATKLRDAEISSQLSRESSNITQQATDSDSISRAYSRRGSPSREFDLVDVDTQEQDLWSPSMGVDYSSMRVSTCDICICIMYLNISNLTFNSQSHHLHHLFYEQEVVSTEHSSLKGRFTMFRSR